jgi:hypothetical protein
MALLRLSVDSGEWQDYVQYRTRLAALASRMNGEPLDNGINRRRTIAARDPGLEPQPYNVCSIARHL